MARCHALAGAETRRLSRENQPQGAGAARSASATGGVDLADPAGEIARRLPTRRRPAGRLSAWPGRAGSGSRS